MSKPAGKVGSFVKKHPWEAAGMAAAAATGGAGLAGMGPLAGLLGGTGGGAVAAPMMAAGEDFAAQMAGKSMAEGAGAGLFGGNVVPGAGLLDGNLAKLKPAMKNFGKAAYGMQAMGMLNQPQQQGPGRNPFAQQQQSQPTTLPSLAATAPGMQGGKPPGMSWEEWIAMQGQQGVA